MYSVKAETKTKDSKRDIIFISKSVTKIILEYSLISNSSDFFRYSYSQILKQNATAQKVAQNNFPSHETSRNHWNSRERPLHNNILNRENWSYYDFQTNKLTNE